MSNYAKELLDISKVILTKLDSVEDCSLLDRIKLQDAINKLEKYESERTLRRVTAIVKDCEKYK